MKKLIIFFGLLGCITVQAQDKGYFSGGFESNFKWYNDDVKTGDFPEEEHVRSNNYLKLDYTYNKWAAGIQFESYLPQPLLSYSPTLDDTGVGTFYAEYRGENLRITAGHFYEQFGSGLILRSWEDRQLGLNNALRGGRIIYNIANSVELTALYGQQREGFKVSDGHIFGFDAEIDLTDLLKKESFDLGLGLSYVGRYEEIDSLPLNREPNFEELTNAFSGRLDFYKDNFYASAEYVFKTEDAIVERIPGQEATINNTFIEPGNAVLLNLGYTNVGLGMNATFRRMENMSFYSERKSFGDLENPNINTVNYIPALTKQHDYLLSNIYVYQAQPSITLFRPDLQKVGEIGGQFDLYYTFKENSALGGEYGTDLAFNASYYANLKGDFDSANRDYQVDFLGFGDKYFSDISIEIKKQLGSKWKTIFTYINQYYNKKLVEETTGIVKTNIGIAEATYKINETRSLRFVAQHLWTEDDKKNWAAGVVEFNLNPRISVFVSDMYNYGNDNENHQIHFYSVGGSFTKGAARVAVNYGRQRGGVVCVGGVCRVVPESTGLSVDLSFAF